jgi:hypothetical protein
MSMENKDDSTKAKDEEELKHRPPSMNYPWYDDEGRLDAMIEALRKANQRRAKT